MIQVKKERGASYSRQHRLYMDNTGPSPNTREADVNNQQYLLVSKPERQQSIVATKFLPQMRDGIRNICDFRILK